MLMTARELRPGQRSRLFVLDVDSGEATLVLERDDLLFEAPNWTPDDRLLVNGDGRLFEIPAPGEPGAAPDLEEVPQLVELPLPGVPGINNDHVLSPDGATIYVSGFDGHLYAVDLATGSSRRVSNDHGDGFAYFLHGVSPDDQTLAYIGMTIRAEVFETNVYTIPTAGGPDTQLTADPFPDDGCEYSPDGEWLYFNSERRVWDHAPSTVDDSALTAPGHAQLFRMRPDGTGLEQLTFDERVNWFPHPSPTGSRIAYLSFPPGTLGHPADLDVIIRLLEPDGTRKDLVHLFGGQGTINVPSWSPDGRRLAYVDYPID